MEEDRMPKKIFTQKLEGTRRRGRSRKVWREEVERDLQVLGVRRWRELVINREKWRCIVRQAKAHSGLGGKRKKKTKKKICINFDRGGGFFSFHLRCLYPEDEDRRHFQIFAVYLHSRK
jgi:hypothetical protein